MDKSIKEPRLDLAVPANLEYQRGLYSTTGPNGCLIQYRGNTIERAKIHDAAERIEITYGMFMRCIVNDAADAIHAMTEEEIKLIRDLRELKRTKSF